MKNWIFAVLFMPLIMYGRIDCEYMGHVQQSVIKKIYAKYNCSCFGQGGAAFYDIDKFFLSFQFYEIQSEVQFRITLLDIADIFIETINQDKVIRPFLRRYPASTKSINLELSFPDQEGEICSGGLSGDSVIAYKYFKGDYNTMIHFHETYEETFRKIQHETGCVE